MFFCEKERGVIVIEWVVNFVYYINVFIYFLIISLIENMLIYVIFEIYFLVCFIELGYYSILCVCIFIVIFMIFLLFLFVYLYVRFLKIR